MTTGTLCNANKLFTSPIQAKFLKTRFPKVDGKRSIAESPKMVEYGPKMVEYGPKMAKKMHCGKVRNKLRPKIEKQMGSKDFNFSLSGSETELENVTDMTDISV